MSDFDAERAIDALIEAAVTGLRAALDGASEQEQVIRRSCNDRRALGLSPMNLWDYFAIGHSGIPSTAGYDDEAIERLETLFVRVADSPWRNTSGE